MITTTPSDLQSTLPRHVSILTFKEFFGGDYLGDPLALLKGFDKAVVLGEIAALNHRLKPRLQVNYDTSLELQTKELHYFCGSNPNVFNFHLQNYKRHIKSRTSYPLIFARQTCLYAMENIAHSDLSTIPGFKMSYAWPNLFQYLLLVNSTLVKKTETIRDNKNYEELAAALLPVNELSLPSNPLYTGYRGCHLLQFLSTHSILGPHFKRYFHGLYNIKHDHFVYELFSIIYTHNKNGKNNVRNEFTGEEIDTSFIYSVKSEENKIFEALSKIHPSTKTEILLSIRKFPFVKAYNKYILSDQSLLLDKAYSQIINDFWFDHIKEIKDQSGKSIIKPDTYWSYIGSFLESYAQKILSIYRDNTGFEIKMLDELIITENKQSIEISDVYIRQENKIFLGEIKATGIYDDQKYSGEITLLYRNDPEKFFKGFGLDQLVNCINKFNARIKHVDKQYNDKKKYTIYPAIIVHEKALRVPYMSQVFNAKFSKLLKNKPPSNLNVQPLSIIHIGDLEEMEDAIHEAPTVLWKVLKHNTRNDNFIPAFHVSLNQLGIHTKFKSVKVFYESLIKKYFQGNNS